MPNIVKNYVENQDYPKMIDFHLGSRKLWKVEKKSIPYYIFKEKKYSYKQ